MKKTYWMILAAGMMCLAACHTEQDFLESEQGQEAEMRTEVITATVADDATKATVADGGAFGWVGGTDKIAVHTTTGYVTTTAASATGASANFSVTYPSLSTRDAFAIFPSTIVSPSAANYGQEGHTLDVTLPGIYTLEQVSGTATPCPMIATNTPGSGWTFSQLCGLLRVTLNNLPPSTKSVTIDFNGKKVQGAFSIASPYSTIVTDDATGTDDIITINTTSISAWTDGLDVNIPIPVGTYTKITVTSWTAAGGTGTATLTMTRPIKVDSDWTCSRQAARKVTASLPVFSVGGDKYITFAPGNLQYQASTNTWRFAEQQYAFVGGTNYAQEFKVNSGTILGNVYVGDTKSDNGLASSEYSGWIDLFMWGASGFDNTEDDPSWHFFEPWTSGNNYSGYPSEYSDVNTYGVGPRYSAEGNNDLTDNNANGDWGIFNTISGYSAGSWHLPDGAAFNYIISSRGGNKFTRATITMPEETGRDYNGDGVISSYMINGLIIFPDNFTAGEISGVQWNEKINNDGAFSWEDSAQCTSAGWNSLEEMGCVFLPAAGTRRVQGIDDIITVGQYWTSTGYNNQKATGLYFRAHPTLDTGGSYVYANSDRHRVHACSVRLVRDLN